MKRSIYHPTWKDLLQATAYVAFAFLLIFLGACIQECRAQEVVRKGNTFYQQSSSKKTIQKDSAVTLTPYTYVIEDVKYPVYKSSRGSYFIIRTNKKGEQYRKYVTKEILGT